MILFLLQQMDFTRRIFRMAQMVVLFFLFFSQPISAADKPLVMAPLPEWPASFHEPFWRKKPEVQKRMKEDGLIVVSAKTDKIQDNPKLFEMKVIAGGDVDTPLDFAFSQISNYENLKKADSHFVEVKYTKNQNLVDVDVAALGYHADMLLRVHEIERTTPFGKTKEIHWLCIKGQFEGMKGVFQVMEVERQKAEISMTAEYRSAKLPLPKVLMGFGLEVIGRQVANQMKRYITSQYHAEQDHGG
jgi:hypothetical protein